MRKSAILAALVLLWAVTGTATGQDITPKRKNAVSLSIFPLTVKGVALSYSRKLMSDKELVFTARFQPPTSEGATEPGSDASTGVFGFFRFVKPDPQSWYNHYMVRVGLRIPLSQHFGYEPTLQLGYGDFYNKVLLIDDSHGEAHDVYQRLDRVYYSAGLINTGSWIYDWNRFRLKTFVGIGTHIRRYEDTRYQQYVWGRNPDYDGPQRSVYYRAKFSLHAGVEVGFRF